MFKFVIEEEFHAWRYWEYDSFEDALYELSKKADLPWDNEANRCPCISWKNCSMCYRIVKYDTNHKPYWKEVSSQDIVEISSKGVKWFFDRK